VILSLVRAGVSFRSLFASLFCAHPRSRVIAVAVLPFPQKTAPIPPRLRFRRLNARLVWPWRAVCGHQSITFPLRLFFCFTRPSHTTPPFLRSTDRIARRECYQPFWSTWAPPSTFCSPDILTDKLGPRFFLFPMGAESLTDY